MISTVPFQAETGASTKQGELVKALTSAWEKKNSKTARAGGVSLMALSLAACGSSSDDTAAITQADVDAAVAAANAAAAEAATAAAAAAAADKASALAAADAAAAEAQAAAVAAAETAAADAATAAANAAAAEAAAAAATAAAASEAAAVAVVQAQLDTLQAAYDALTAAVTDELDTDDNTPTLSVSDDAVTATSTTLNSGDIIVDGQSTDSDTLTVTLTGDFANTPTVVNIETVTFNIAETLASGNNELSVAVDNISGATIVFDVTADDSLITNLAVTGADTNTYTASSEFSTIAMTTATDADIVLNVNADASVSTTGAADDLTISGGTDYDVTLTASAATEDLVVTGAAVDITTASIAGTVTVDAAETAAVDAAAAAGAVSITAGTTATVTDLSAAAAAVTVTGGTDVTIGTTAGTDLTVSAGEEANITATSTGDVVVTSTNNASVTVNSATGDVTVTAGASETGGALTTNAVNAALAEGTVTVTSSDDTAIAAAAAATVAATAVGTLSINATAATTVTADNTGADAGDDVTLTDTNSATSITVTSVGNVATTAALAALETGSFTIAEASTIDLTGASDAAVTITATDDLTATLTLAAAGAVATVNAVNGGNDLVITVDEAENISGDTFTTSGTGTTVLLLDNDGTSDITEVSTDIIVALGDTFDTTTLTAADSGQTLRLDEDQTGTVIVTADTAANTDNSITFSTVSTNAATAIAALTVTDYATVNIDSANSTVTFSGVLSGDQLATVDLAGDNAISFGTTSIANTATTPTAVTVDASDMTAALTLDLNGASGGVETVEGSSVGDDIDATAVSNSGDAYVINTNAGADTITVSAGANSTISAGAGIDTIEMAGAADVTVDGGTGIDTLSIAAGVDLSSSTLSLTSVEQIELTGGGVTQTLAASYISGLSFIIAEDGTGTANLTVSMDQLAVDLSGLGFASSFATGTDTITVDASVLGLGATIVGSAADDVITGSGATDSITAGEAADIVDGGAGADVIVLTETTAANDVVHFDAVSEGSAATGAGGTFSGFDVITGFGTLAAAGAGADDIDVAGITVAATEFELADQDDATAAADDLADSEYTDVDAVIAFLSGGGSSVVDNGVVDDYVVAVTFSDFTALYGIADDNDNTVEVGEVTLLGTVDAVLAAGDFITA